MNLKNSPKCYFINSDSGVKRSCKGTPKYIELSSEDYLRALFQNEIKQAEYNRISADKRYGSAVTRKIKKKALNSVYIKMKVHDDLVQVSSH